ncbi:MAG: hypothetical protein KJO18_00425, partial [Acidimicrobiia bacterium]|nr:hypothetical protein [Acidimicrobiia bacterium]
MSTPAVAKGNPVTVTVTSVAELEAAIGGGADTILVEPGDYVVDGSLLLEDVDLIGTAEGVVFSSLDPGAAAAGGEAIFRVAGSVLIENVGFTGGGFTYVGSAFAVDAQKHNDITIRASRFETASFVYDDDVPFDVSLFNTAVTIGNGFAHTGSANSWDVDFSDNYVRGGFAGPVIGNFYSDASGSRLTASIHDNFFEKTLDPAVIVIGAFAGVSGTVSGTSRDNTYSLTGGLSVGGGIGDFFFGIENPDTPGLGGSGADVDWLSKNETFVGPFDSIGTYGGRRYRVLDSPSAGNDVRVRIQSATFGPDNVNGVSILASSINDHDPVLGDFSANGDGEGNTLTVTMTQVDFSDSPAGVWIRNHGGNADINDYSAEPSYGNEARITGSPTSLAASNPGVNDIPAWFF